MRAGDVSNAFNEGVQHLMHWMATFLGIEGMRAGQAKITHGAFPCFMTAIYNSVIFVFRGATLYLVFLREAER